MDRMADAISCRAIPNAEAAAGATEEQVIVGVLEILLYEVMVDVLRREFGTNAVKIHRLQFEHHQRAGGVLCQSLIDAEADRAAGQHLAFGQVRANEFPRDVRSHNIPLSFPDSGVGPAEPEFLAKTVLLYCSASVCLNSASERAI